jgi:hypothetical protein
MTVEQAVEILDRGADLYDLAEAIGTLMEFSRTEPGAVPLLLKGLRYPGLVADQAAMTLYGRLSIPRPPYGQPIEKDLHVWTRRVDEWLGQHHEITPFEITKDAMAHHATCSHARPVQRRTISPDK